MTSPVKHKHEGSPWCSPGIVPWRAPRTCWRPSGGGGGEEARVVGRIGDRPHLREVVLLNQPQATRASREDGLIDEAFVRADDAAQLGTRAQQLHGGDTAVDDERGSGAE